MADKVLFDNGTHRNVLLEDSSSVGSAVQANQHLIIHNGEAMLLDPGGHKVYSKVLTKTFSALGNGKLRYLFLSHQDPDIVAAVNGWLMTTDATAYISGLWERFVPHFGLDHLLEHRLLAIPDEGMSFEMGGEKLYALPGHFLHSVGNFQLYDPVAKILYSGDLGASLGMEYFEVTDFEAHLQYMEGFHKRYMTCKQAMSAWADMVRKLDIDIIAPQHGALFSGKPMVKQFIDWCANLDCGIDLMTPLFNVPAEIQSATAAVVPPAPPVDMQSIPPAVAHPAAPADPWPAPPEDDLSAALADTQTAAPADDQSTTPADPQSGAPTRWSRR
jgi:flavorubredoxin